MKSFLHRSYPDSQNMSPEETVLYRVALWLVAIGGVIAIFWNP